MMVQLVKQRLKGPPQIREVHDPAGILANRAADMNFDSKGMAVQACALVAFRDIGQAVSGFNLKNAKNIHGRIVPPGTYPRKVKVSPF